MKKALVATALFAATGAFAQVECEIGEIKKWSSNRFQIEDITVTNTGNSSVAWQVNVVFDRAVAHTGNWSSEVTAAGNVFTVSGNQYNSDLGANKSTDFGIKGEGAFSSVSCEVDGTTTPIVEPVEPTTPAQPQPELPSVPVGESVYNESFESYNLGAEWESVDDTAIVNDCGEGRSQCLRVSYAPTDRGSDRLQTKVAVPAGSHYSLIYDIKFADGFEFVRGGKLPGLAPTVHTTGCDEAIPNGWSARPMWRGEGSAQGYYYSQQRDERCGDGDRSDAGTFKVGQWQRIELELKLNSASNSYDGFIDLKVDGVSVSKATTKKFRETINNDTLINHFFFSTFYGGADPSWAPSQTTHILYDNIQIVNRGGETAPVEEEPVVEVPVVEEPVVDPIDPVDGSCQQYTPSSKVELDLRQGNCVQISTNLAGKTFAAWDSDANSSCDFRGSIDSVNGAGSIAITSNYKSASVLTGTKIKFNPSNGCQFIKIRVY